MPPKKLLLIAKDLKKAYEIVINDLQFLTVHAIYPLNYGHIYFEGNNFNLYLVEYEDDYKAN
jgi:hypothetical protein